MNDFFAMGGSFDQCLSHLAGVLKRCKDCNRMIYWEKCNFIVNEGILASHLIWEKGIEVD